MSQQKKEPLISVIIPTFNRAVLLPETLRSVMAQSYIHWECIVVDDGSTDDTLGVLADFAAQDSRIRFYKRPSDVVKGVNACRLLGFEKSNGAYISWFDSDDIMHPDKLLHTVRLFKDPDLDCVIHNFNYFRTNVYFGASFNDFGDATPILERYFSGALLINFPNVLLKKVTISKAYLRTDLSYAEDVYFIGNQFLKPNYSIKILDEVLMHVRKHEASLTTQFTHRPLELIEHEVFVRAYFWNLLKKQDSNMASAALKMYLKALKYYLYSEHYRSFFKNMFTIFTRVHLVSKFIVLKLLILSLFYIFTKKGMARYQKVINAI